MKALHNRIAESNYVLPVMSAFGVSVWFFAGLVTNLWWPQFACFCLSVYMMMEMNNAYALLRVRSSMVPAVFIALSCTMSFMFGSLSGGLTQFFAIVSLLILFSTYQDSSSLGRIFYSFLLLGLCSILFAGILWLVPLLWLLMATQLQSLSWRGFFASLIGLATPYWFFSLWFIYQRDFSPLAAHFCSVAEFMPLSDAYATLSLQQVLAYALIVVLMLVGIVHFWHQSIDEKIRTRLFYGEFTWLTAACLLFTALQPQHFDPLMRIAVVSGCAPVAHLLTLSSSRISTIVFFVILVLILSVTVVNLLI